MIASFATTKVRLYVAKGDDAGRSFRVRGPSFVIGRGLDCQLRLNSSRISRRHAEVDIWGDAIFVRDLCSRNGTYLNGERIMRPMPLADGDRIEVGPLRLIVSVWAPEEGDESDDVREGDVPELSPEEEAAVEAMFRSMEITDSLMPDRGR